MAMKLTSLTEAFVDVHKQQKDDSALSRAYNSKKPIKQGRFRCFVAI